MTVPTRGQVGPARLPVSLRTCGARTGAWLPARRNSSRQVESRHSVILLPGRSRKKRKRLRLLVDAEPAGEIEHRQVELSAGIAGGSIALQLRDIYGSGPVCLRDVGSECRSCHHDGNRRDRGAKFVKRVVIIWLSLLSSRLFAVFPRNRLRSLRRGVGEALQDVGLVVDLGVRLG